MLRRLHAAHLRHVQVHDDHVRCGVANEPDRLDAVSRLAEHLDALLFLQQVAQSGPEEVVVVDQNDPHRFGRTVHNVGHVPPGRRMGWHLSASQIEVEQTRVLRQWNVIVTVRPNAAASEHDLNQTSIRAPWTAPPVSAATPSP